MLEALEQPGKCEPPVSSQPRLGYSQLPGGDHCARVAAAGREALGCTEQGLFATHFCVSLQTVLAATALYLSLSLVGSTAARAPTGRRETNQGVSLPRAELLHL